LIEKRNRVLLLRSLRKLPRRRPPDGTLSSWSLSNRLTVIGEMAVTNPSRTKAQEWTCPDVHPPRSSRNGKANGMARPRPLKAPLMMKEMEKAISRLSTVVLSAIMAFHVERMAPSATPEIIPASMKTSGDVESEQMNMERGSAARPTRSNRLRPMRSDISPKGMALIIMARPDTPIMSPTCPELTPTSGR